jgi:hypothetical protein
MKTLSCSTILLVIVALPLAAQDFNVDMYDHYGVPSDTYGAAGQPGAWNAIPDMTAFDPPVELVDTAGAATAVTLSFPLSFGGLAEGWIDDAQATGDDHALLEDGFWSSDIPNRARFQNLADGEYEVKAYGIVTSDEGALTTFLFNGASAGACGGIWNGTFEEGVTHVLGIVNVSGGMLDVDWVNGGGWGGYGMMSGIQLDYIEPVGTEASTWSSVKELFE